MSESLPLWIPALHLLSPGRTAALHLLEYKADSRGRDRGMSHNGQISILHHFIKVKEPIKFVQGRPSLWSRISTIYKVEQIRKRAKKYFETNPRHVQMTSIVGGPCTESLWLGIAGVAQSWFHHTSKNKATFALKLG